MSLEGQIFLITGGTGSFGRAFTKYALTQNPEAIRIFSRGEHAQAQMRVDFKDDERLRWLIGDVRDSARLDVAMESVGIVVHAAALKRIEVGELNPTEMVKTNVGGALNVVECATKSGHHELPRRVIAISSDKACEPLNCYGATKLTVEKIFLAANESQGRFGPNYAVCRYGNVAGSQGSVIPLWRNAEVINVTDPDCTRFWMTLSEAVHLVVWTLENMKGGEMVVPDLPAYDLLTLAKVIAGGKSIRWQTGMRPGEKRHETMIGQHECQNFHKVGNYWLMDSQNCEPGKEWLSTTLTSDTARRMAEDELRERLKDV